ncbi:hypothetical protein FSOLCH5_003631 [Fusarium solani]|nr:hypothetical protein MRS44_015999 [Fusarium solani]
MSVTMSHVQTQVTVDDPEGDAQADASQVSHFAHLPQRPTDEAFNIMRLYTQDKHPNKVALGGGVYQTESGRPWPLPVVAKAEAKLFERADLHRHDYLGIAGDLDFVSLAQDLVFGLSKHNTKEKERIASVQTISGTGANHIGAMFIANHLKPRRVWISNPTWINHHAIWRMAGVEIQEYPYYDASSRSFNFEGTIDALENKAQPGDVVLFQACAHNPTGLDPTKDQWNKIADVCRNRRLFPFFDCAYQGFATGSPERDAWALHRFLELGIEMGVAQSFSKNFSIYGQRTGAFHLVLAQEAAAYRESAFKNLCFQVRGEYSTPPRHGAAIIKEVLGNDDMYQEWLDNLGVMSDRIKQMRQELYNGLVALRTPGTWEHILNQIGMFSYLGLTPGQVAVLVDKYHIYAMSTGRACIAGLNPSNVKYVVGAIDDVVRNVQ